MLILSLLSIFFVSWVDDFGWLFSISFSAVLSVSGIPL